MKAGVFAGSKAPALFRIPKRYLLLGSPLGKFRTSHGTLLYIYRRKSGRKLDTRNLTTLLAALKTWPLQYQGVQVAYLLPSTQGLLLLVEHSLIVTDEPITDKALKMCPHPFWILICWNVIPRPPQAVQDLSSASYSRRERQRDALKYSSHYRNQARLHQPPEDPTIGTPGLPLQVPKT